MLKEGGEELLMILSGHNLISLLFLEVQRAKGSVRDGWVIYERL